MRLKEKPIQAFPFITFDKIRYRDTDRQGHVNNAVFGTYFETGRVELLYDRKRHILNPDCAFVVAKTTIDLLKEIHWPGQIDIGTGILRIGQSSIVIGANLYQNGHVVATSETIVVQVSELKKTSVVLSEDAKKILTSFLLAV
jgi:acyl-CoA thioester hydrolase